MPDSPVKEVSSLSLMAGERIRAARTRLGLSQAELAERMGERQSVVSEIERGRREIYLRHIQAASEVLGMPEAWFVARPEQIRQAIDALVEGGVAGGTALTQVALALLKEPPDQSS